MNNKPITTNPKKSAPAKVKAVKPKVFRRVIRHREAVEAASRLRTGPNGKPYVIRFNAGQRVEHLILLFSFTTLGVTGLAQTFYTNPIANAILTFLGGIDSTRFVHHTAAFVFIAQSIYHLGVFVNNLFVFHKISKILPDFKDFSDLIQMLKFNLGLSSRHPQFDRYNFEEKAEYWALVWGTLIMGATGLMQWFPLEVTQVLPGWAIPVARALHKWEAILAVLAILTWHFYHTMIKTRNFSIFTGKMTIEQMEEEHPLELAYLRRAAAAMNSLTWPVVIEIPLDGMKTEREVVVKAPVKAAAQQAPAADPAEETEGSAEKPTPKASDNTSTFTSGETS